MLAQDFMTMVRDDLQEKSEFWTKEVLFVKLQQSYIEIQGALPCFIANETVTIKEGSNYAYLKYKPLQNIVLIVDGTQYDYADPKPFYADSRSRRYTFEGWRLLLHRPDDTAEAAAEITYCYARKLETVNCEIEIPALHYTALRYLFMSKIYEKSPGKAKERDLSTHYLKLYKLEVREQKLTKTLRPSGLTSKYQRV